MLAPGLLLRGSAAKGVDLPFFDCMERDSGERQHGEGGRQRQAGNAAPLSPRPCVTKRHCGNRNHLRTSMALALFHHSSGKKLRKQRAACRILDRGIMVGGRIALTILTKDAPPMTRYGSALPHGFRRSRQWSSTTSGANPTLGTLPLGGSDSRNRPEADLPARCSVRKECAHERALPSKQADRDWHLC